MCMYVSLVTGTVSWALIVKKLQAPVREAVVRVVKTMDFGSDCHVLAM